MKRRERLKLKRESKKKKLIIGTTIIGIAILFNSTVSFADADLNGLMISWYNKKTEIIKSVMQDTLNSEIENQKLRVKEELKKKLDASALELDNYSKQEIQSRKNKIAQYADELIEKTNFSNDADKAQINEKLDKILESAKSAMNSLVDSYTPPKEVYVPEDTTGNKETKAEKKLEANNNK